MILVLSIKMEINEQEASTAISEITDVMSILEAEPSSVTDHREQLAVLVMSGGVKEMTGIELTQDQVKRLSEKDV